MIFQCINVSDRTLAVCLHVLPFNAIYLCICYCVVHVNVIIYCQYYCYWESALNRTLSPVRALAVWLSPKKLLKQQNNQHEVDFTTKIMPDRLKMLQPSFLVCLGNLPPPIFLNKTSICCLTTDRKFDFLKLLISNARQGREGGETPLIYWYKIK